MSEIPDDLLIELRWLQGQMSQVRGNTPLGDPKRQAGEDFCKLAIHAVEQYGVSFQDLSKSLGLSPSAVRLALGRRGYIPLPPSQGAYKGTLSADNSMRKKKSHCKRGHALEGDNLLYTADGTKRRCRACRVMLDAGYAETRKLKKAIVKGAGDE